MSSAESYEKLPYPSAIFSHTHPSRLAATARLHGINSQSIEKCRVLELGCSDGGNLINIAYTLPNSECVGIDYARGHISRAENVVSKLSLMNCAFYAVSVDNLPSGLGHFDYIIAHGLYSWTPPDIQLAILRACGDLLTPHGVAYISYNAFPGWRAHRMMRETLARIIPNSDDIAERINAARRFLSKMQKINGGDNPAYTSIVANTNESFRKGADSYLGHEFFEDDNNPVYFHEFIEKARSCGLDYAAEAHSPGVQLHNAPDDVLDEIYKRASDRVEREQWLDFFIGRQFRRTLLCKANGNSPTELNNDNFRQLFIDAHFKIDPDSTADAPRYLAPNGTAIGSKNQTLARAMAHLSASKPIPVSFGELLDVASGGAPNYDDEQAILALCRQMYDDMLGGFYAAPPRMLASEAGEFPKVSKIARLRAASSNIAATLLHSSVQFDDPIPLIVLRNADGKRSREDLLAIINQSFNRKEFGLLDENNNPLVAGEKLRETFCIALDICLEQLANYGLIEL